MHQQLVMVEPRDPFERGQLDGYLALPGRSPVDQLGLVEPVDRLRKGVIVAVPPFEQTDGSIPACARRSECRMLTYCDPRSP